MIKSKLPVTEGSALEPEGVPRDGAPDLADPLSVEKFGATGQRRKLIPWAIKGGTAILDQGLVSGSNFVIGILLARWLTPDQYGAYAVAFSAFLLVLMLYQSLVLEPLSVFGAATYRDCGRGYLKVLLSVHLPVGMVICFVFCAAGGVALQLGQRNGLPGALCGVGIAGPLILLFWLGRRMLYSQLSPLPAAAGALLYCAVAIGGLLVAARHNLLSPLSALLLMGAGSTVASFLLLACLRLRLPSGAGAPSLADVSRRHWGYGSWALASAAIMWIPTNIFYPLVSSFSGMVQAAELRALMNFAMPMAQTYAALASLLLPYAANVQRRKGSAGVGILMRRITWLYVTGAFAYWAVLLLFKGPIFRLVYSGRYTEVAYLLPVVALGSVSWSAFLGPATGLRAMESPASVFAAASVASCLSFAIGVPATWAFGVRGAVWAMALAEALAFVPALVLLRRKVRSTMPVPVSSAGSDFPPIAGERCCLETSGPNP